MQFGTIGPLSSTLSMIFRWGRQVNSHLTKSLRTVFLTSDRQTNLPHPEQLIRVAGEKKSNLDIYVCIPHELPTKVTDSIKHWPSERQSQITESDFTQCFPMDFALALPSGEAPLKKPYRAAAVTTVVLGQGLSWVLCALRKETSFPLPFPAAKHYISPPPPSLPVGLTGGLHLPALRWLLLGGKEAHPDGFQQFHEYFMVFYWFTASSAFL